VGDAWVCEWGSVEKTGVVLIETYFPNDLMTVRWVHFHSSPLGLIGR
jgi:hypothetical protein